MTHIPHYQTYVGSPRQKCILELKTKVCHDVTAISLFSRERLWLDNNLFLSTFGGPFIYVLDVRTMQISQLGIFAPSQPKGINSIAKITGKRQILMTVTADEKASDRNDEFYIYDFDTAQATKLPFRAGGPDTYFSTSLLSISPNGLFIAYSTNAGRMLTGTRASLKDRVMIRNLATGQLIAEIEEGAVAVWTADNQLVVMIGGEKPDALVFDPPSGKLTSIVIWPTLAIN